MNWFRNLLIKMNYLLKLYIRYPIEFIIFIIFFSIFRILPLGLARKLGLFITSFLGPLLPINDLVKKNLKIAFENKNDEWIKSISHKVWENMGETIAEYSHLDEISKNHITIIKNKFYAEAFNTNSKSIIISAHSSNWEIPGMSIRKVNHEASAIVREPNNPLINFVLKRFREKYSLKCLSKDISGTKQLLTNFGKGDSIALLADLQLSTGIDLNFFNREMKFSSLPAQIALKAKCNIFLAWPVRKNDGSFEFKIHDSIKTTGLANNSENILKISRKIVFFFESMIEKYPEQYFWFHNRWKLN